MKKFWKFSNCKTDVPYFLNQMPPSNSSRVRLSMIWLCHTKYATSEVTSRLMDDDNTEEDPFAALEEDETELYENEIILGDDE